jgi:TPR repeat protein
MTDMAEIAYRTSGAGSWDAVKVPAPEADADTQTAFGIALFRAGRLSEAVPWFDRAAQLGDARAQYMLGVARYNGDGCARDEKQALSLLRMAADQGIHQARHALDSIGRLQSGATGAVQAKSAEPDGPATAPSAHSAIDTEIGNLVAKILPAMLGPRLDVLLPEAATRLVREEIDRQMGKAQANPERS